MEKTEIERPHAIERDTLSYKIADKLIGKGSRNCKKGSPYDIQRTRIESIVKDILSNGYHIIEKQTKVIGGGEAVEILKELCSLKKYIDEVGKDSLYLKSQPLAWERANNYLNSLVSPSSPAIGGEEKVDLGGVDEFIIDYLTHLELDKKGFIDKNGQVVLEDNIGSAPIVTSINVANQRKDQREYFLLSVLLKKRLKYWLQSQPSKPIDGEVEEKK